MKFESKHAPHIAFPESTMIIMGNVVILLLALYGLAYFYNGARALILGMIGIITCVMTEYICLLLHGKHIRWHDLSALITGMMIPLMMPASVPFYVPVIAGIFAIAVAKHPFGGLGHNIFNPAAAGYAFAVACFPASVMFTYPVPLSPVPIFGVDATTLVSGPSFLLNLRAVPLQPPVDMALGNMPGPMGATNGLVLVACLIFLISRRTVRWETPVFFLATTSICALLFKRAPVSPFGSMLYETMSGLLLFGAVFMLADPVTTPTRRIAKIGHAVLCGLIVMIYRHLGRTEEGFAFAVLLMNASVWGFDIGAEKLISWQRRKRFGTYTNAKTSKKT